MSYLVDALKKAERERHENQRADLRSLAGGEPSASNTGRALRWLVGMLVACNAALLVYLFLPAAVSAALVENAPGAGSAPEPVAAETENDSRAQAGPRLKDPPREHDGSARAERTASDRRVVDSSEPAAPVATPSTATPTSADNTTQDTSSSMTLPPSRRPVDGQDTEVATLDSSRAERSGKRGQVTYSATPLDDDAPYLVDESRSAPVSDGTPGGAPAVDINGHLYSSVPGRSFILVRGQRYHEGERLAAGPAVESIDATGATLNYRGERYHVKGPG